MTAEGSTKGRFPWLRLASLGALAGLIWIGYALQTSERPPDSAESPALPAPTSIVASPAAESPATRFPAALAGRWQLDPGASKATPLFPTLDELEAAMPLVMAAAFSGPDTSIELVIEIEAGEQDGAYLIDATVRGQGSYEADVSQGPDAAAGLVAFSPEGGSGTDHVGVELGMIESDLPGLDQKAGDVTLLIMPEGDASLATPFWLPAAVGRSATSVIGAWKREAVLMFEAYMPYLGTLDLGADGRYRLTIERVEKGRLVVAGQQMRFARAPGMGPPFAGPYHFDGDDRLTVTDARGQVTWVRAGAR